MRLTVFWLPSRSHAFRKVFRYLCECGVVNHLWNHDFLRGEKALYTHRSVFLELNVCYMLNPHNRALIWSLVLFKSTLTLCVGGFCFCFFTPFLSIFSPPLPYTFRVSFSQVAFLMCFPFLSRFPLSGFQSRFWRAVQNPKRLRCARSASTRRLKKREQADDIATIHSV